MTKSHIEKVRSRGYWRVVIRPATFNEKRVDNILDLQRILESCAVRLRGWDFPHVDQKTEPEIGQDSVSQNIDIEMFVEYWRFYQSGQFVHLGGFKEDWLDQRTELGMMFGGRYTWPASERLGLLGTIFRFTEIFEFATRMSLSEAGDKTMDIQITLNGLESRILWTESSNRAEFFSPRIAAVNQYNFKRAYSDAELAADTRNLALEPAIELFRRFGWDASLETVRSMQEELRG